jgi:hypothetical protein
MSHDNKKVNNYRRSNSPPTLQTQADDSDRDEYNFTNQLSHQAFCDLHDEVECSDPMFLDVTSAVSPMTPAHRFSDVKRILTNFAMSTPCPSDSPITSHAHSRIDSDTSSVASSSPGSAQSDISRSHSVSSALTNPNTPPLTPDSFNGLVLSSSSGIPDCYQRADTRQQRYQNCSRHGIQIHEENHTQYNRLPHAQDIKEGKRPQRPIVRVCIHLHILTIRAFFLIVL